MRLESGFRIEVAAKDAQIKQGHSQQGNDASEVGANGNHVSRPAPSATGGERNRSRNQQIAEYTGEVDAAENAGGTIQGNQRSGLGAREEDEQFGDRHRFRENDRDGHEQDEIPRLVSGQQFHIVSHRHDDFSIKNERTLATARCRARTDQRGWKSLDRGRVIRR